MAEKEVKIAPKEEVEEEEVEEEQESGFRSLLIPVLTSAITTAVVGGLLAYFLIPKLIPAPAPATMTTAPVMEFSGDGGANAEEDDGSAPGVKHTGVYHQYDTLVVSIFDREKVHYLRIKIALELSKPEISDEITVKDPQIKDALITVLGDFTVRELLDNQSKLLVKEVMLKTLARVLGKGKVIDVYFTEFVVQ